MHIGIEDVASVPAGFVLADFYTPTCQPCKQLIPVLEELHYKRPGVRIVKIDVTQHHEAAQRLGIRCVPTVMVFEDNKVIGVLRGSGRLENLLKLVDECSVTAQTVLAQTATKRTVHLGQLQYA